MQSQSNPSKESPDMLVINGKVLTSNINHFSSHKRPSNSNSDIYKSIVPPHIRTQQVESVPLQKGSSQKEEKKTIDIPSPWNQADFNPFQPLVLPKHPKPQNLVIDVDKINSEAAQQTAKIQ